MDDLREKVMNGLQMSYTYSNVDEENTLVPQKIVLDAISLLKEAYPEPHLLTREELREVKPGTILWKDYRDHPDNPKTWHPISPVYFIEIKDMIMFDGWDEEEVICFSDFIQRMADYGNYEVYWTAKPTTEQRKAVKWE